MDLFGTFFPSTSANFLYLQCPLTRTALPWLHKKPSPSVSFELGFYSLNLSACLACGCGGSGPLISSPSLRCLWLCRAWCSNSPRAKRLRFLACSLYERPAILVISLPALLWTFCNFNAVPFLSRRTAHNLKGVNQGLIRWHFNYFPLLSLLFLFISTHFHFAFTHWSIITARSHLRMQAVISETTSVYADLGLSFPTCITLQLCTMNFSCCFIAQPFSLVGPFCNFSQFAHIPIILHNLVSSAVFTSRLIPFFDDVCIY